VVDHGPFPLASLKTFNLAPAMASVHTTLVKNHQLQMAAEQPALVVLIAQLQT
jgi:uncharacterized protein YdgA (DUF945 family)